MGPGSDERHAPSASLLQGEDKSPPRNAQGSSVPAPPTPAPRFVTNYHDVGGDAAFPEHGGGGAAVGVSSGGGGRTWSWLYLLILGALCALPAIGIQEAVNGLDRVRTWVCLSSSVTFLNFLLWLLFAVALALPAAFLVHHVSPNAAGSGIPEMKSILSGVVMNHYLSMRTLVVKVVGLTLSVAAGLSIGREGPYVHIASIVASKLSYVPLFRHIRDNEALKVQMLSAACAAGVSATFGAPVGGVLFSMEVTSTYYMISNIWKAFFAAVIGAVLGKVFGTTGVVSLFSTDFEPLPYDNVELVIFGVLGMLCGVLGALLNWTANKFHNMRKAVPWLQKRFWAPVLVVTLLTASLSFPFPYLRTNQHGAINQLFTNELHEDWAKPSPGFSLVLFTILKFLFTAVSVTLPIPCGIFTPVFAIGAGFGRLCGELVAIMLPNMNVVLGGYAVVGAAALTSGVTRTISTSVIVFELTSQLHHMLPILIAVLLSVGVGNMLNESYYDQILLQKNLPHISPANYMRAANRKSARDIMRRDVPFLTQSATYFDVADALKADNFPTIPLVESDGARTLIGAIQRGVLVRVMEHREGEVLLAAGMPEDDPTPESPLRRLAGRASRTVRQSLSVVTNMQKGHELVPMSEASAGELEDGSGGVEAGLTFNDIVDEDETTLARRAARTRAEILREEMYGEVINFGSPLLVVDPAPFQIVETTPSAKVHFIISMLGSSVTYVTSRGRLVGVITKETLATLRR